MERIPHGNGFVTAGGSPGELDGHPDGAGSTRGKQHLIERARREFGQLLGQRDCGDVRVATRAERKLVHLRDDSLDYARVSKAGLMHVVAMKVQDAPALKILDRGPGAARKNIQTRRGQRLPKEVLGVLLEPGASLRIDIGLRPSLTMGRDVEVAFALKMPQRIGSHKQRDGLLLAGALQRIPIPRIDECLRVSIRRVGGRVDVLIFARLGVPVVEGNDSHSKMPLWFNPLVSWKRTLLHDCRIHARRLPPKTAAPRRRAAVRFLIADDEIVRGTDDAGPLEVIVDMKLHPANSDVFRAVRMVAEKPAIAGITLPGMPSGSPGMDGPKTEMWTIYAVTKDGKPPQVFATV